MFNQKRPFHEVLSEMLRIAPVGITSSLSDAKAAELMTAAQPRAEEQDEGG